MQNILRFTTHKNKALLSSLLRSQKGISLYSSPSYSFAEEGDQSQNAPKRPRLFQSRRDDINKATKEGKEQGVFNRAVDKPSTRAFLGKGGQDVNEVIPEATAEDKEKIQGKPRLFADRKNKEARQQKEAELGTQKVVTLFSQEAQRKSSRDKFPQKEREALEADNDTLERPERADRADRTDRAPRDDRSGKSERTDKDKPAFKKREVKLFGRKDVQSGFILDRLAKDLQRESQEAVDTEVSTADRKTILSRIATLKQLENVPKKFQNLMELYLILEEPQNAEAVYNEAQKLKIKNPLIENLMFDAAIMDSYPKAKQFYTYLKENKKLDEVFYNTMCQFVELQAANDSYETLGATLQDLKALNFNLVDLDFAPFNKVFGFDRKVNLAGDNKKIFEFLKKAEIFVDLIGQVFKRNPPQVEAYSAIFKFKTFFKTLNNIDYPKIKLDSNGNDICLLYLETLGKSGLINTNFVDFDDVSKYIASFFDAPIALPKIASIVAQIKGRDEFFPAFNKALNHYIGNESKLPFTEEIIRSTYAQYREEAYKNKVPMNHELLQFFLELAQVHRQYDIVFDIYENYNKLTLSNKVPAYVFKAMANTFTYIKLTSSNSHDVVNSLITECNEKHEERFTPLASCFLRVKALIRDKKYEEAHGIYESEFLNDFIARQQRVLIYAALNLAILEGEPAEQFAEEEDYYPDIQYEMGAIKEYVQGLKREDLLEIHSRLQDSNELFKDFISNENINEHINYWNNRMKEDIDPDVLREEYEAKRKAFMEESAKEAEAAAKEGEEPAILVPTQWGMTTPQELDYLLSSVEPQPDMTYDEETDQIVGENEVSKYVMIDFDELNADKVVKLLSGQDEIMTMVKRMVKIPIQERVRRKKGDFYETPLADKPVIDYVCDLILWGIYHNEPLAVQLGEAFYETIGHTMPDFIGNQIKQYYRYQAQGALNKTENSFSYTQANLKKPERSNYLPKGGSYDVIEDDPVLNQYIDGLRYDSDTYDRWEQLSRKQSFFKDDLFGVKIKVVEEAKRKAAEENKAKKQKFNLVNY